MLWLLAIWGALALWELVDLLLKGDYFDAALQLLDCLILGRFVGLYQLIYWWTFDYVGIKSRRRVGN